METGFLSEIVKIVSELQDPINRFEVNIFIASQFNLVKDFEKALDFIEKGLQDINLMASQDEFSIIDVVNLRCKAARQLAKLGQSSRSIGILHTALQQAIEFDDYDCRDYTLIDIAEVYAEMGLYNQAIQIGLLIDDDFRRIDRLFYSIAFTAVIEHSDHEQIQNILAVIDESIDRDNFLVEIASNYSAYKQSQRAIDLVSLISDPYSKACALVEGVKGMDKAISQDLILGLLTEAETYACLKQNLSMRASAQRIIASEYIDLKLFIPARILLEQAKNIAITISAKNIFEQVPRDYILQAIAVTFAKLKEFESTLETLNAMTDRGIGVSTLIDIAKNNPDSTFKSKIIQELIESENALIDDKSHLADLRRVNLANSLSKMDMLDRVQLISDQISDPILKELALGYGGLNIGESEYDRRIRLTRVCHSARKQNNLEAGLGILRNILEEMFSFNEGYITSFLTEVVENYFCLLKNISGSISNE